MMDLCPCKQDVCSLGSKLNRLWSLLLYSLEKLAGQYFFYPFSPFLSPTSIMELVIICPTYPCSNNLSHFTLWAISLQLTPETSNNIYMHAQTHINTYFPLTEGQFSGAHVQFLSVQFALHRNPLSCHPPPPSTPNALTVWGWKPIRLFSSTHERIPVKAPTEENGPCPLIYRLSHEEGLLMHLELTSCVQKPISLLFPLCTILLYLINHIPFCPFNNISAVLILICALIFA